VRVAFLVGFSYPVEVQVALRFDRARQRGLVHWIDERDWPKKDALWTSGLGSLILSQCAAGAQEILILSAAQHVTTELNSSLSRTPAGCSAAITLVPLNADGPAAVRTRIVRFLGPESVDAEITSDDIHSGTGGKPVVCVAELGHPNGFRTTLEHAGFLSRGLRIRDIRYKHMNRNAYVAELEGCAKSHSRLLYASSGIGSLSPTILNEYAGRICSGSTALNAVVEFVRVAAAIHQDTELGSALEMQRRLMPSLLPDLRVFDAAAHWKPAKVLGGDFYDIFLINEQLAGILIADVSGKGPPAAILASNLHGQCRGLASHVLSPSGLVTSINDWFGKRPTVGKYATIFYAVLNCTTGELLYCNAGHNRPFVLSAVGQILELSDGGMPVGLFPAAKYVEGRAVLSPEDLLVAYTDGITEATNALGEEFGEEGIMRAALGGVRLDPKGAVDAMLDAVQDFADFEFQDDVTLIALRRKTVV
jgi:hypothetical protein